MAKTASMGLVRLLTVFAESSSVRGGELFVMAFGESLAATAFDTDIVR